jgi:hypothetical protein
MRNEYRYVERETYEGKQLRAGGSTRGSLEAMKKHLHKVGKVKYVKGYVYIGIYDTTHIGVVVRGDKGYIRFGGFNWGYSGQGPRGLADLLKAVGVQGVDPTTLILGENAGCSSRARVGTHWKLGFNESGYSSFYINPDLSSERKARQAVARKKEEAIQKRLRYLRRKIKAECISLDEVLELEELASHIDPDDVLLLEWAGVPETTAA